MVIPGALQVQVSLTHVENLCAAVASSLQYFANRPDGAHRFNVADPLPYDLRAVVGQLLPAVCGRPLTFQELPLAPLLTLAGLLERLRIPASFTRFGLAAVTQGCVLDLKKTTRTLDFQPQRDFWEALPELCAWVGRVGRTAVRGGEADLPWREMAADGRAFSLKSPDHKQYR